MGRADMDIKPYIEWNQINPFVSTGKSNTGADADLWSVAPEYGAQFGLTFSLNHYGFRINVDRPSSGIQTVKDGQMFGIDPMNSCFNWTGNYEVVSDLPDWKIKLDVNCKSLDLTFTGEYNGYIE